MEEARRIGEEKVPTPGPSQQKRHFKKREPSSHSGKKKKKKKKKLGIRLENDTAL